MELNLQIWQTLTHTSLVLKMLNLMLQANMILWNMLDGRESLDALLLFLFWLCACNIYNLYDRAWNSDLLFCCQSRGHGHGL